MLLGSKGGWRDAAERFPLSPFLFEFEFESEGGSPRVVAANRGSSRVLFFFLSSIRTRFLPCCRSCGVERGFAGFFAVFAVIDHDPAPVAIGVDEHEPRAVSRFRSTAGVRLLKPAHACEDVIDRKASDAG